MRLFAIAKSHPEQPEIRAWYATERAILEEIGIIVAAEAAAAEAGERQFAGDGALPPMYQQRDLMHNLADGLLLLARKRAEKQVCLGACTDFFICRHMG